MQFCYATCPSPQALWPWQLTGLLAWSAGPHAWFPGWGGGDGGLKQKLEAGGLRPREAGLPPGQGARGWPRAFLTGSLSLPAALQATRALMVVSIVLGVVAMCVATMGMKCTRCGSEDKAVKARIAMAGGIVFMVGGELAAKARLLVRQGHFRGYKVPCRNHLCLACLGLCPYSRTQPQACLCLPDSICLPSPILFPCCRY